ncbi:MAG: hypothetical protein Q4D19_07465 [Lautropia sp.]|nr:hypothetical protein [Lautropia sp.]
MIASKKSLLASAVLMAMLTACGGSSDSGSPGADGAAPKSTGAEATSAQQDLTTKAPAADPVTGANAITAEGVRAELVAAAMVKNTFAYSAIHPVMGPRVYPVYFGNKAVPWSGTVPGGNAIVNPTMKGVYATQQPQSSSGDNPELSIGWADFNENHASTAEYGVQPTHVQMSISADKASYEARNASIFFKPEAATTAGKAVMSLGTKASVQPRYTDQFPTVEMKAAKPFELRVGETLPYYKSLQRWEGPNGEYIQLMLFRGEKPNELRLCADVNTPNAKRLTCHLFDVAANWKFDEHMGLLDTGAYVVDDRTVIPGHSGHLVWQTPAKTK